MPESIFFRLLKTPIDEKGDALAALIAALNASDAPLPGGAGEGPGGQTFALNPTDFTLIPGSPFAYWVSNTTRRLFTKLNPLCEWADARVGLGTGNDFRFVRAWWELYPKSFAASHSEARQQIRWALFAKGGAFAPYYSDIHLAVRWDGEGAIYWEEMNPRMGKPKSNIWQTGPTTAPRFFFRPGLTWPGRTQKGLNVRALPAGCIFAGKGPSAFVASGDETDLLALLAVMNSLAFRTLVKLQMAFGSYEVGVIQRTPVPPLEGAARDRLAALAREAHDLQRDRDRTDETTHAFGLPGLALHRKGSLLQASRALEAEELSRQQRLSEIQAEIDDIVFDLYDMDESDRALIRAEMADRDRTGYRGTENTEEPEENQREPHDPDTSAADPGEEEAPLPEDIVRRVQDLLMWCVGVAFGRWDVRMALDPSRLPPLGGPFDPLPCCAPGALVGPDGLPATEDNIASDYPLPIPWDGILVDDPTHPSDIVARVRKVLTLVWGSRADDIERETCQILGIQGLRDWFRDPRRFFAFHIKRYSKSRRKAPIYWPLQSEKRNYTIWLYYHRMRADILYAAGRFYTDYKIILEQNRLEDLQSGLESLSGASRRFREREIEVVSLLSVYRYQVIMGASFEPGGQDAGICPCG